MPYIYEDTLQGETRNALSVPSTTSDVLAAQFQQGYEENPIMALKRLSDLGEAQVTGPRVSAEDARTVLQAAGMEHDITVSDAGITRAALNTLIERKRGEKRRQEIFARSEGGFGEGAARFGVAVGATLTDPLSFGLNFVPVVGQTRYARWLNTARSIGARIAIRGAVGAAEGAVGAAIAEVPIYAMRTQEQADYDMADSLLNVAFGGVVGAGLHTTVGTVAELIGGMPERRIPRASDLSLADRAVEQRLATRIAREVDSAVREYAGIEGTAGGKILNTDLARELSPEYRADRTRSAAVHEPASYLVKQMYARKLAEPPAEGEDALVVFSAGGTGAGKTTGLELVPDVKRAQIIYDTNMNSLKSAADKIDQALDAGKNVKVVYTWRDPTEALTRGALPRAMRMGRTVPIDEHARTHVGAARTIKELAERYKDDPRVSIDIIDNSLGKNAARVSDLGVVRDLEYNAVREDLLRNLEAARASGSITEAVYRGTAGAEGRRAGGGPQAGRGNRGESESPGDGRSLTAAERVSAAPPEVQQAALRTAVAQAVEGRPIEVEPILSELPSDIRRLLVDPVDTELRAADQAATDALAREIEPSTEAGLKAAEEEAALAVADMTETAKRLGVEAKNDPDFAAVMEGVEKAERWARVAELATVCLVRGG